MLLDVPSRFVVAQRTAIGPLNEFPADATHVRLARGGLDKQAAILPLMGRITMDVLEVELAPNSTPILAGREPLDLGALAIPIPRREGACCACRR